VPPLAQKHSDCLLSRLKSVSTDALVDITLAAAVPRKFISTLRGKFCASLIAILVSVFYYKLQM